MRGVALRVDALGATGHSAAAHQRRAAGTCTGLDRVACRAARTRPGVAEQVARAAATVDQPESGKQDH
jgi:hypothetical protein